MTLRHAISLTFAAALLASGFASANAATTHHPKPVSHGTHRVAMHRRSHAAKPATSNADHSADALNAQSLTHAQSAKP